MKDILKSGAIMGELRVNKTEFTESDIEQRNNKIISNFIEFMDNNNLLKKE